MSAPERIWMTGEDHGASWSGSFRAFRCSSLDHSNDDGPNPDYPEYIRKDASDAAIAAARAEGVRAAMERSEEAFMDAVWSALKADANDLRKQQRILRAYRAAAEAQP